MKEENKEEEKEEEGSVGLIRCKKKKGWGGFNAVRWHGPRKANPEWMGKKQDLKKPQSLGLKRLELQYEDKDKIFALGWVTVAPC